MPDLEEDLARLESSIAGLESTIVGAESMTTAFRAEVDDVTASLQVASRDAATLSRSLGMNLRRAFEDLIFDGARLSDVLGSVGRNVASSALSSALRPVANGLGAGIVGGLNSLFAGAFANGAAFSSGRVRAFAEGGIVRGPTRFPMRGGVGLMGEAGPEAILPLSRGSDGQLGVRAQGGGAMNVTMNITTPDAESFRRSRTQVAAQLGRALGQGRRNQ